MSAHVNENLPPRNRLKMALLTLATLPFVVKFAYLEKTWISSPIDRMRMGVWGTAALLVVVVTMILKLSCRYPTEKPLTRSRALRVMLLPIALYAIAMGMDINALQLVSSIGILWAAAWALYGRQVGFLLVPAVAFAIMAVPGSSYWLERGLAGLTAPIEAAYVPGFSAGQHAGYIGREVKPDRRFTSFFRTSDAHQFRYSTPSNQVTVLAVKVGNDIHEIHPATHCLRSSGWHVADEELVDVRLPGRETPLSVSEAVASCGDDQSMLMWVWYSSAAEETGSFIRFRRLYSKSVPWRTYQITTPVTADGVEAARKVLTDFLSRSVPHD